MLRYLFVLFFILTPVFFHAQSVESIDAVKPRQPKVIEKSGIPDVILSPANDACAGAITLTPDAACTAGTTNAAASTGDPFGGSSCIAGSGAGCNVQGVWYSFTANNDSMNLDIDNTSAAGLNCNAGVAVYGPNQACTPSNAVAPFYCKYQMNSLQSWNHMLTGLTVGATYLVYVEDHSGGGPGQGYEDFCINITTPLTNDLIGNATQINNCGVGFTGSTANASSSGCVASGGYNNLDCNAATTCSSCGAQPGADVTFSIENDSWFYFCAVSAGTYNVTLNNVTGCSLGTGYGVQLGIFSGTTSALTQIEQGLGVNGIGGGGTNPSSYTSSTFAVAAGACIYMMVDGYAGNECSYDFTLTNVSGGCVVLPIELVNLAAKTEAEKVRLNWSTLSEKNNSYFTIERSKDALNFEYVTDIQAAGNSSSKVDYSAYDIKPYGGVSYYRIRQTDYDGASKFSNIVSVNYSSSGLSNIWVTYSQGGVLFHFEKDTEQEIGYAIYDVSGKLITSGKKDCAKGPNKVELSSAILAPGLYILKLTDGLSEKQQKFITF